jgi:hypothetical protein
MELGHSVTGEKEVAQKGCEFLYTWGILIYNSSVDTQPRTIAGQVPSWIEYLPDVQIPRQQVRGNNACNGNTKGPTITMLSSATQRLTQQL